MDGVCLRHTSNKSKTITDIPNLGQLLVDDKHKVIYCDIPKAGSSSWKYFLLLSQQKYNANDSRALKRGLYQRPVFLQSNGIRRLGSYTEDEISQRLNSYIKFIVVRNPIVRLISAYSNKFIPLKTPYGVEMCGMCRSVPAIMYQLYGRKATMSKRIKGVKIVNATRTRPRKKNWYNATLSLNDFLSYVTKQGRNMNPHWSTYHELCQPCTVSYDYVVKMETHDVDADHLTKLLFNTTVPFPRINTQEGKVSFREPAHVDDIHSDYRARIERHYGLDMQLFNYKYPWASD